MYLYIFLACLATATALPADKTNITHNNNTTTTTTTTETPSNSTKELLKASETGDPTQVEIVKQIRRLNEDGSYTIGYEATDGTFKIESRDVLGNVKGTFGYIDDDGEIKRVTYTSNGESTPVPVSTSTTPSTPVMIVRVNKTVSSTTRRPLPTVVYPTRGSATTRGTVIQSIPRRRLNPNNLPDSDITTEKSNYEETTQSFVRFRSREESVKMRTTTPKDDLVTKQTTLSSTVKPVYEEVTEKEPDTSKPSAFRRELPGRNTNHHMVHLQQSMGDDSTDVYGSHLSHGTLRPLFTTTTTNRPRLVPLRNLIPRQNTQEHYPDNLENQETTIEASTGRVFDTDNMATSSPVPIIHIQPQRLPEDQRVYQQTLYRRPQSSIQFRTQEYLKDNPGAPIPIGNQRPFLQYDYQQNKVLEPQLLRESQPKASNDQYEVRPVTRIIQVPVDERGVPIPGYEPRYVNPYQPQPQLQPQQQPVYQRYDPTADMNAISAPVSTRDLKRLLQILILRQSRLQALMDQLMPGPYQPYRDMYRQQIRHYDEDDRYDYRYDQQYRQDAYANQDRYEEQYDNQRYVPRRRYSRPYDSLGSSSNHIDEAPEYLPVEVREALLLKMLLLAISPEYTPRPVPPTELTTAAPTRKQVRNVQILGEEGATEKPKRH